MTQATTILTRAAPQARLFAQKVVFLALAEPLCISVAMIAQLKSRVYQLLGVEYIDRKWLSVSMALSHWSLIPRKT